MLVSCRCHDHVSTLTDQENERDDVGVGSQELFGIPETTCGAEEQGRSREIFGHRIAQYSRGRHQRLGIANADDDTAGHEEAAAGHRAKDQRQAGQEAAEAAAKSANLERRTEKSAELQDLIT